MLDLNAGLLGKDRVDGVKTNALGAAPTGDNGDFWRILGELEPPG